MLVTHLSAARNPLLLYALCVVLSQRELFFGPAQEYDESREKYQIIKVTLGGKIEYLIRLPRGLQHRGCQEVRIPLSVR